MVLRTQADSLLWSSPNLKAYPRGPHEGYLFQTSKCKSWEPVWLGVKISSCYQLRQILDYCGTPKMAVLGKSSVSRTELSGSPVLTHNLKPKPEQSPQGQPGQGLQYPFQSGQGQQLAGPLSAFLL